MTIGSQPTESVGAQDAFAAQTAVKVHHKTVKVDDLDIFYREAGPKDAPAILLLHGFPTSSQMFRNLIPMLADAYRVVAPDYPGYGHSVGHLRRGFHRHVPHDTGQEAGHVQPHCSASHGNCLSSTLLKLNPRSSSLSYDDAPFANRFATL
jgi:pimeloyl-ACP methyl ester carboxylesterase